VVAWRFSAAEAAVMAVRQAIREGASEAEAFVSVERGYRVTIMAGVVKDLVVERDAGVAVRAAVGKRVGFAYATGLDASSIREAARLAVRNARASREDEWWGGFPEPSPSYPEPGGIYEASLARVEPETLVEDARELLGFVAERYGRRGVAVSRASLGVAEVERAIANSNGVYRVDVGTFAQGYVALTARFPDGRVSPSVFEFGSSRVSIPSMTLLAERAAEKVLLAEKVASGLEPGRYRVVFAPEALAELLEYTVLGSLNGEMAVRGRSFYRGRVGERVMDERLTIVDDGVLKGGDATWRFDGEGVAMQRTVLVEKGVLRGFIFDSYWGRRMGVSSTGNAVRPGYTGRPSPGFTNVVVAEGDASPEELLEGRVIVVYSVQGAHTANMETGEYSVVGNPAVLYENGEPRGIVPGAAVSGNIYEELASRVEMVGRLVEKPYPGMYVPWLRLEGVHVAPRAG